MPPIRHAAFAFAIRHATLRHAAADTPAVFTDFHYYFVFRRFFSPFRLLFRHFLLLSMVSSFLQRQIRSAYAYARVCVKRVRSAAIAPCARMCMLAHGRR